MKLAGLLFLSFSALAFAGKPTIGIVDMDRIFQESERKMMMESDVNDKIESLKTSSRVTAVREMDSKLKALAKTVRDEKLTAETRELAAKEFNSLSAEYQSLVREMEEFIRDERQDAKRQLVESVEALVNDVRQIINQIAKEEKVDFVLEIGGKTSSQVSPIIYLRDKVDLTDKVLVEFGIALPEPEVESEEPT